MEVPIAGEKDDGNPFPGETLSTSSSASTSENCDGEHDDSRAVISSEQASVGTSDQDTATNLGVLTSVAAIHATNRERKASLNRFKRARWKSNHDNTIVCEQLLSSQNKKLKAENANLESLLAQAKSVAVNYEIQLEMNRRYATELATTIDAARVVPSFPSALVEYYLQAPPVAASLPPVLPPRWIPFHRQLPHHPLAAAGPGIGTEYMLQHQSTLYNEARQAHIHAALLMQQQGWSVGPSGDSSSSQGWINSGPIRFHGQESPHELSVRQEQLLRRQRDETMMLTRNEYRQRGSTTGHSLWMGQGFDAPPDALVGSRAFLDMRAPLGTYHLPADDTTNLGLPPRWQYIPRVPSLPGATVEPFQGRPRPGDSPATRSISEFQRPRLP
jgi:hypothetical protein